MEMIRLEECCEILDSMRVPITAKDRKNGSYPYYGANGVQDYVADYIFDDDLVLLAEDGGNFGSEEKPIAYRISGKCWVNNHAHVLKPKEGIDVDYLCYSLMFYKVDGMVNGATRKKLTQAAMRKMLIPARRMEKQKEIVNILNKVQNLIEIEKEQIKKYDEIIKSRFVEMFGDPVHNPYGFEISTIGDCYKVKGGKRIPKGMGYANGITEHPYLRATDMKNATILDRDVKYISNETYQHIKNYTVSGGDIYLTNVGVNLGMAGVIPEKYNGANLTENAVKLVPVQDKLIGIYLSYYINSPGVQRYIMERKMTVGVPKLAIFRIESMPLLVPAISLQKQFASFAKQANNLQSTAHQSLKKLQTLQKSLMQQYFT